MPEACVQAESGVRMMVAERLRLGSLGVGRSSSMFSFARRKRYDCCNSNGDARTVGAKDIWRCELRKVR
jgi:hypothetical protein